MFPSLKANYGGMYERELTPIEKLKLQYSSIEFAKKIKVKMSEQERVSYSIHVGDLSPKVNEKTLYEIFKQVGTISSIKICKDRDTGASLGYGYVNFQNPENGMVYFHLLTFFSNFSLEIDIS